MRRGTIGAQYVKRPPKERPFDNVKMLLRDFTGAGFTCYVTPDEALLLSIHLQIAVLGSQKHDSAYRARYVEPREVMARAANRKR